MKRQIPQDPQRRRFMRRTAAMAGSGAALMTATQTAKAESSEVQSKHDDKALGYQKDSEQVQTYYQRARY